jgi:hypothetical protein
MKKSILILTMLAGTITAQADDNSCIFQNK